MSTSTPNIGLVKPAEPEQYDLDVINNNSDAIDLKYGEIDKVAKGLVFESKVATNSGNVTDAIINNIASFTFKAGRRYRIEWDYSYIHSGNGDSYFYMVIGSCATSDAAALLTGITTLEGRTKGAITAYGLGTAQHTGPVVANYAPGASDQTLQIKFRALRVNGDDGITIVGNAGEPAKYCIYDDGKQI
jgi:hypothetical protein